MRYRLDSNQDYFNSKTMDFWLYDSYVILDRLCIPTLEKYI